MLRSFRQQICVHTTRAQWPSDSFREWRCRFWECALAPSLAPATCFACVQQEGLTKRPGKGPLPKALRIGLMEGLTWRKVRRILLRFQFNLIISRAFPSKYLPHYLTSSLAYWGKMPKHGKVRGNIIEA